MGDPTKYPRALVFKGDGALEMVHMLQGLVDENLAAIVLVEGGFQLWSSEEILTDFSKALVNAPGFAMMGTTTTTIEA